MSGTVGEGAAAGARHGGAPVGDLDALPRPQGMAVRMLRAWCEGPEAQAAVCSTFAAGLGPARGRAALAAFEALVRLLTGAGRRPLMRHGLACRCVGSDEAVFAHLLALAAMGEREDARLVASLLLPAALSDRAVDHAREAGLAMARLSLRGDASAPSPIPVHPHPTRIH